MIYHNAKRKNKNKTENESQAPISIQHWAVKPKIKKYFVQSCQLLPNAINICQTTDANATGTRSKQQGCEALCLFHETSAVVVFVVRFSAGASLQAPTTPHRRCGWSALFSVVLYIFLRHHYNCSCTEYTK